MADDLTRRAIIAAHDAECDCGDIPSDNSEWTLTDREQAIVALWRAEYEGREIERTALRNAIGRMERVRSIVEPWQSSAYRDSILRALDGTEATP